MVTANCECDRRQEEEQKAERVTSSSTQVCPDMPDTAPRPQGPWQVVTLSAQLPSGCMHCLLPPSPVVLSYLEHDVECTTQLEGRHL